MVASSPTKVTMRGSTPIDGGSRPTSTQLGATRLRPVTRELTKSRGGGSSSGFVHKPPFPGAERNSNELLREVYPSGFMKKSLAATGRVSGPEKGKAVISVQKPVLNHTSAW